MRQLLLAPALAVAATLSSGCSATEADTAKIDAQLDRFMAEIIESAEVGPDGRLFLVETLSEPAFLEPESGHYWQINDAEQVELRSRSLWEETLEAGERMPSSGAIHYESNQFTNQPLRIAQRTVRLSGSAKDWQFVVALPSN